MRKGFRSSRGYLDDVQSAAFYASTEEKARARRAQSALGIPFAYNACLVLIAEGEKPMPARVRAEAKRLEEAVR
jgi:hypothetical protein